MAGAARYFSRKLGHHVSEITIHSIKKAYLEGMKEKRAAQDDGDVTVLLPKKHGRPVYFGENPDTICKPMISQLPGLVSAHLLHECKLLESQIRPPTYSRLFVIAQNRGGT